MKTNLIVSLILILALPVRGEDPKAKGTCYTWSALYDKAFGPLRCRASTLAECSQGAARVPTESIPDAYKNPRGLFFAVPGHRYPGYFRHHEFRKEDVSVCQKALDELAPRVESSRARELEMSKELGVVVYSVRMEPGETGFIYGSSVILRGTPSIKGSKVAVLENLSPLKIVAKSKEPDAVPGLIPAHWFQVVANGQKGWVYGQFVHPEPMQPYPFDHFPGCGNGRDPCM